MPTLVGIVLHHCGEVGAREEPIMGKQSTTRDQVDVTYVKRGQVAAIEKRQPQPSKRAKAAIVRAASRRSATR